MSPIGVTTAFTNPTILHSGTSHDAILTDDGIWCGLRIRRNRSPKILWITMMVSLSLQQKCC